MWIATGHTDMRRDMYGLALQVQEQLKRESIGVIFTYSGVAVANWMYKKAVTVLTREIHDEPLPLEIQTVIIAAWARVLISTES